MANFDKQLSEAAAARGEGQTTSSSRPSGRPSPPFSELGGGKPNKRGMAHDFLQHYKSELPPGMAELLEQKLEEGEFFGKESSPSQYSSPALQARIDRSDACKARGQELMARREFTAAIDTFDQSIRALVGNDFRIPSNSENGARYMVQKYLELDEVERGMLMSSCAALAAALFRLSQSDGGSAHDLARAFSYCAEVEIIHKHLTFSENAGSPEHQWKYANLPLTGYWQARMVAMVNSSSFYETLGNTSMAWHLLHTIYSQYENNFMFEKTTLKAILPPTRQFFDLAAVRHPEPRLVVNARVTHPDLQVLGSWEKLHVPGKGLVARQGDASFVWKSRLYVLAGYKTPIEGPFYGDLHYLDLNNLDGWHTLPSIPIEKEARKGPLCSYHAMFIHRDVLYYFMGTDTMCAFDLVQGKWRNQLVQLSPAVMGSVWPAEDGLRWFASTYVPGREQFYVFGGKHRERLGCDFFLVMDMRQGQWRQLSGNVLAVDVRADYSAPGPRVNAMMWHDAEEQKIYLLGGEADRSGALMYKQEHGASISYPYDDFWSWDIEGGFWTRERVLGNPPCPRSEAGYVFNPNLNSAFIFGGYNPAMNSTVIGEDGRERMWEFQYFADTFMLDMSARSESPDAPLRWKQVLTRGFPTYRACSKLITDPTTGKIFLYGGYTSHEYLPFYKQSRCFSDIWQLKLDVPGGFFGDVDVEEEARSAKAGPWQRCFTCGSTGRSWKKCGGSCNGRVLFCGKECQIEGWKEHKRVHNCKKK